MFVGTGNVRGRGLARARTAGEVPGRGLARASAVDAGTTIERGQGRAYEPVRTPAKAARGRGLARARAAGACTTMKRGQGRAYEPVRTPAKAAPTDRQTRFAGVLRRRAR